MVVDQLKKRANASMKDHFLDNWANLKSGTQIAELFDNYEDVQKVNSKPMDRGRNFNTCTPGICSGISAAKGYARKVNQCSQKNSEEIKSLYEQAASQVLVTNQVYSLEKELLLKNREDKLALRTVSHKSTGSPSELVYGKNLRTPETLVMEHWMEPEEEVLVLATSRANKLAVQWIGPGTILNKISETNYLDEIPGRRESSQIYHINMLKPYYKRPEHVNDFEDVIQASELNKHLHDKQMDRLRKLLNKYSKCFSNNPGLTNLVEHEIQLVSDQPIRAKPYRMSHRQIEILKNEINRMLKLGIIEVGESDYMSPMILVEVAGKEPRPCIDYRKLNGIIRTEYIYFPLPNIEERVEKVSAAKFITVIDLSKGY
ncbi:retrovirus-related Pol polyprotein from transposon 17.6 [Trichonephila clavipes]|nr:retrovirus-related Pol polyprotein from transposon 17.6 [Trichonephila clavipes]